MRWVLLKFWKKVRRLFKWFGRFAAVLWRQVKKRKVWGKLWQQFGWANTLRLLKWGAFAVVITVLVGPLAFLVVQVPRWQAEGESKRFEAENEARRTVVQTIGGALGLLLIYFGWRRIKATEETVRISEQGQITERFTRAIDQLGNEQLAVRLGGVYALERIARDSKKDHWPIMETLTAFVRLNSPWKQPTADDEQSVESSLGEFWTSHLVKVEPQLTPPRTDIQAVLTVIRRRELKHEQGKSYQFDLSRTDLRQANIGKANLKGSDLTEANLEGAHLGEANLEGADLWEANLEGADLWKTHLEGANLRGANLEDIQYWDRIAGIKLANIEGVLNPPEGFVEWAKERGAVEVKNRDEWKEMKEKAGIP